MKILLPLLLVVAACAATSAPPPAKPAAAPGPEAARVAHFRAFLGKDAPQPSGEALPAELKELTTFLAATDPTVRDDVAFSLFARWLIDDKRVPAPALRQLEHDLSQARRVGLAATASQPAGESDQVFGRSFAALVASLVAAAELKTPSWSDAELAAVVDDACFYAEHEHDLRGYVPGRGWAHAAAHTADWLKFLARNPRLAPEQSQRLLMAVASLATRRHGYNFHHGEDSRLAQPILALLARNALGEAGFRSFLEAMAAPLREQPKDPATFDAPLYAAQRNARNLLFTLFVALSLDDQRTPTASAALELLAGLLRS